MSDPCYYADVPPEPKCVALIPARGGSKRIPGKNVKLLGDHPLLAYTIAAAKASGVFGEVWVSSDDGEIRKLAAAYGAGIANRLPQHATDTSPDIEWVADLLGRPHHPPPGSLADLFDCFAILRPTSPFRTADTIRRAWAQWCERGAEFDSLRAVEPVRQHPGKMWVVSDGPVLGQMAHPLLSSEYWEIREGEPPAHSRPTQTLEPVYVQNASLEIAWAKTVSEQRSISGSKVMPFFTEGYEGLDLNTPDDWEFAEWLVASGKATLPAVG